MVSELSGHFKTAIVNSLHDAAHVNARALFEAIDGAGTTETVIYQVIALLDNAEIVALHDAYQDGNFTIYS